MRSCAQQQHRCASLMGGAPGRRSMTIGSSNSHTRCGWPSGTSRAKCTCSPSSAPSLLLCIADKKQYFAARKNAGARATSKTSAVLDIGCLCSAPHRRTAVARRSKARTGYHWCAQSYPLPLALAASVCSRPMLGTSRTSGSATAALAATPVRATAAAQVRRRGCAPKPCLSARHAAPAQCPCHCLSKQQRLGFR